MSERRYKTLRRRITREYRQAQRELAEELTRFLSGFAVRDAMKRFQLSSGEITAKDYKRWQRSQVFQGKRWQERVDKMAEQLSRVDEAAAAIINDARITEFTVGMNLQNRACTVATGISFDLYDDATVARLLDEQPQLLPPRRVKKSTDVPWYHKQISNAVTQGILQGESIPDIAQRVADQTGERGRTAALRNARTAMTSAQNAGRVEAMHEQEKMGIRVQKKWMAAHDARTREAHALLDGQTVDVDEPFESILGEIMFPGDPHADPANVYNCRCALGYVYPEYQR